MPDKKRCKYSIVIPVYNEEDIVKNEISFLVKKLDEIFNSYEIIIVENGSTDNTSNIVNELEAQFKICRVLHLEEANVGKSIRRGVLESSGEIIFSIEVDSIDINFIKQSITLLETYDLVQVSKKHNEADWESPMFRKFVNSILNLFIYKLFKFKGTDTHGNKAYRRDKLIEIVDQCTLGWGMYRTEFRLRSQYSGIKLIEVPSIQKEIRKNRRSMAVKIIKNVYLLTKLYNKLRKEKIIPK